MVPAFLVLSILAAVGLPQSAQRPATADALPRVTLPTITRKVPPHFAWPAGDTQAFYELHVDVVVDAAGTVAEVRLPRIASAPEALSAAVIEAVRQWQIAPRGYHNVPGEKAIPFTTTLIVRLGACADGQPPGSPLPYIHRFCPTATAAASAPAAPASVPMPPAAAAVPLPEGIRRPPYARAMLGPDLWTLGGDQRRSVEMYAAGVARYLDPAGWLREDVPRPRHPRVGDPACAALTKANADAFARLFAAMEDTLRRAGGLYNERAFQIAAGYVDDGFADAHLLMSQPQSGCRSETIRRFYASVALIAAGRFSSRYLKGHHTRPVAEADLQRSAAAPAAARAAAAALAAHGFTVLVCDFQGVVEPVVVWHRQSPALRAVRGLDPAAAALGTSALGRDAAETCQVTYEAMQGFLPNR
jgi:hypothetical protein